jgi:hypothetical protein
MTYPKSLSALAVILVLSIFVKPDLSTAQPGEDSVLIDSIRINGVLGMNQPVSEAIRLLGNPDHRKDFESLAFGPMTELYYGQSRLAFIDGVLQEFEILDSRLFLTLPAGTLSFGDDSAHLRELLPKSYAARQFSDYIDKYYLVLLLNLVMDGKVVVLDLNITIVLGDDGKVEHIILEQLV